MKPIFLDFETFWSQDHSLTKIHPVEYVMHPETEIQSVAIKEGFDGETFVLFGEYEIQAWVDRTDFSNAMLVGHNMAGFDAMICAWRFGIRPKAWSCTLAIARALGYAKTVGGSLKRVAADLDLGAKLDLEATNTKGKKLADFTPGEIEAMRKYNAIDTDLCAGIFKKLAPKLGTRELKLIDMTIRMLVNPQFELDEALLESTLEEIKEKQRDTLLTVAEALMPEVAGGMKESDLIEESKKILASAPKFAKFLISKGVPVPMKQSPSNPEKEIPALAKTDEDFLALQEHEDFEVAAAASARLGVKSTILESRIEQFLRCGRAIGGRMPIALNYYGADTTGRFSGTMKMNQQNLPRVSPKNPKPSDALRKCLVAPQGKKVVVADLSGIELRVNHFLWKEPDSMKLFQADPEKADLYKDFASKLYKKPWDEVTKAERQLGKVCIAEGSEVLTDKGLVPIERVTTAMKVWDGVEWVSHDGPIFKGEREVISYDGATATPDHEVFTECGRKIRLDDAAAQSLRLERTGAGRTPLGVGHTHFERVRTARGISLRQMPVHWMRKAQGYLLRFAATWENARMSVMQPTMWGTGVATETIGCRPAAMREPEQLRLPTLWGAGRSVSFRFRRGCSRVGGAELGNRPIQRAGQKGQRWPLRAGESSVCVSAAERRQPIQKPLPEVPSVSGGLPGGSVCGQHTSQSTERGADTKADCREVSATLGQTKRRVWDILNAGPRNRFTVSGRLVSNCQLGLGFGSGPATFQKVARLMGGVDLSLEESEEIVSKWRNEYGRIASGWRTCQYALDNIHYKHYNIDIDPWGLCKTTEGGIKTPLGMIRYPDLRQETNEETGRQEWVYGHGRKKARIYGPKITENLVQHLARETLCDMMLKTQERYPIAHTVHDEVVLVVDEAEAQEALDFMQEIMRGGVTWWPELVTWSEGGISTTYGDAKD